MLIQSLKMAWKAIGANKMRTFLTMLGIIIGVVALVVLVSLVTSTTNTVTDSISALGTNYLTVNISDDKGNPLRLSDMSEFTENEYIEQVAPVANHSATAKYGYNSSNATIYGVTSVYFDVQGVELEYGRLLKTADVENNSYVAVVSRDTAEELYETTNILGETLMLDGIKFTVVGVLAANDNSLTMRMSNLTIYIPYTTAVRISSSLSNTVTSFYATAPEADTEAEDAEEALTDILLHRFKEDEDAFDITNMNILADTLSSVTSMLALLLGGIAAISLLVGGIGIMNIMLVSVTERTKEIGIRKAIGAGNGSIMLQFLIEALVVSLMGCAVGIMASLGIIEIASLLAGDTMTFSLSGGVVMIAVLFSVAIGVIFGIYPANKAAKKHPIEALRYDG